VEKKFTSSEIAALVVEGMQEKKGNEIVLLDMRKIENRIADYFVICHATSTTQADALMESVDEIVKKGSGYNPYQIEGRQNAEWILIDYIDVVVHIFLEPVRAFYNLEALWADAECKAFGSN
jgi:ribosome-associated protein